MTDAAQQPLQPLAGVRVVDFSSTMAAPFAGMICAQLGADVVKVEAPGGDDSRAFAPHVDGLGLTFRSMNTGKRSVVVDLKAEGGVAVAHDLMARADVVLQSMRPGVAERIGIGPGAMKERNPGLLYYDLNAFGSGPLGRGMPGYDPLVQAFSGIIEMNGHEGMPPVRCAPSIIDLGSGQWIAMGILAALLAREKGQPVRRMETALIDTAFAVVPYQAAAARMSGQRPARAGSGNPIVAPYQCYRARDSYLMIAAGNQRLWLAAVEAIGAPQLAQDPRFLTVPLRSANRYVLQEVLEAHFAREDARHWIDRLDAAGVPVTHVAGLEQSSTGEMARERGTFIESDGVPLVRLPWLVEGQPLPWRRPAPRLGEHTREVLREIGYDEARIAALVECGAVRVQGA